MTQLSWFLLKKEFTALLILQFSRAQSNKEILPAQELLTYSSHGEAEAKTDIVKKRENIYVTILLSIIFWGDRQFISDVV